MYETTKTLNSQSNPERKIKNQTNKKTQSQRYDTSQFQTIRQSCSNQNNTVLAKTPKHTNQWNRIESLEMNTHIWGEPIYEKGAKKHHGGRKLPLMNGVGKTGQLYEKG